MKRLAIFVEGQTEQIFVNRLLVEIAGKRGLQIVNQKSSKSKNGNRTFTTISTFSAKNTDTEQQYYILIRDCGGDNLVKSDILESYESLSRTGYEKIIGIRDVYPVSIHEIEKLVRGMRYGVPTGGIPIRILLAIMEVESWFISDNDHFSRLDISLSKDYIEKNINVDISPELVQLIDEPAKCLDYIYSLAGYRYNKKRSNVQRTVDLLDYAELYINLPNQVSSLKSLIDEIDSFL